MATITTFTVVYVPKSTDGNNAPGGPIPHKDTTILLSKQVDGTPVVETITDSEGKSELTLAPGDYIVTLKKDGSVFSKNNFTFSVLATDPLYDAAFDVGTFEPTFTFEQPKVDLCTLYADLFNFDGVPMRDTEIRISLSQGPDNFNGLGTFGTSKVVKTDKKGHVEFNLMRGASVTVSVMSHSLRRTITVPSGTTTILSSTVTNGVTTIVTDGDHGRATGETIRISDHSDAAANGDFKITYLSNTSFTIEAAPAGPGTGGTFIVLRANLMTLLSGSDDLFDIKVVNVPAAPRRTI